MYKKVISIFSLFFLTLACQSHKKLSSVKVLPPLEELDEKERLIAVDHYFLIAHEYLRLGNATKAEELFCFLYPYAPAKTIGLKIVDLNIKRNNKGKALKYLEHLKILYPDSYDINKSLKLLKKEEP